MTRALLALALLSGCAIGGSSSVVGRWKARRIIDSTVCLQSQAPGGGCEKVIAIGRDIPARRFSGALFAWAAPGYMQQRGSDGYVGHGLALHNYFEYYRGRGRFAIGGRIGGNVGTGFGNRMLFTTPVSVVGHLGGLWGSVYAGAGYAPIALEQQYTDDEMNPTEPAIYHHDSVHGFVGTRFWLSRKLERGLTLSPEVRVDTFADSILTSFTFNFGLHL